MRGKISILLAVLLFIAVRTGCGDYSDQSPMLDGIKHTVQEASR